MSDDQRLTYICFETGTVGPADLADLVTGHGLGFEPITIRADGRSIESLAGLRALDHASWITIDGTDGSMRLAGLGGQQGQAIVWRTSGPPPVGLIEAAMLKPGFTAAVTGDADDLLWQSADQINTYEVKRRSWSHLPRLYDPTTGCQKIDVSRNPGRGAAIPGMWLWAGAELWFGPAAFTTIDRARLLSAPALDTTENAEGVIHVRLFSPGDDLGTIRGAQKAFRHHLGYDELEEAAATEPRGERLPQPPLEQLEAWSQLYAATDALELALAAHGDVESARLLARTLLPLIRDIRAGRITEPIPRHRYPNMSYLDAETDLRTHRELVDAHTAFRAEVTQPRSGR